MQEKTAIVSIDVDCMHGHTLIGPSGKRLGHVDPLFIKISYTRWLPRFLEQLAATEIKGTFFLVADFARRPEAASTIRRIVEEGHEIASHTVSHAVDMCMFDLAAKRREIVESKAILEDISGAPVIGFRGPGYAIDATMLELLAEAGYLYDSSVVPGYLFSLYKRVSMLLDRILIGKAFRFPNKPPNRTRIEPYWIVENNTAKLLEIPITVLPLAPIPYVSFIMMSRPIFHAMYRLVARRPSPLMLQFHDFEFLDPDRGDEFTPSKATLKTARIKWPDRNEFFLHVLKTHKRDRAMVTAGDFAKNYEKLSNAYSA